MEDGVEAELRNEAARTLAQIGRTKMPFGRFGPAHFPPDGVPIYDLPAEYLQWFADHGWPRGSIGPLLKAVYQAKADGLDLVFAPFRNKAGGRTILQKRRKRSFEFPDDAKPGS